MGVYLRLNRVGVLELVGWGRPANPDKFSHGYRVELRDVGELAVTRPGALVGKEVLTASIEDLRLSVGTEQVTAGGGWRPRASGVFGMLLASAEAEAVNRFGLDPGVVVAWTPAWLSVQAARVRSSW